MTDTLEDKILKYLKENDNGEYLDLSFLDENKKLLESKIKELTKRKLINEKKTTFIGDGYSTSKVLGYKILIDGIKYINETESKNSKITNNFNNSSVGQFNQSEDLSVLKTEIKHTIHPITKEKQQNAIAERIGKWFWQLLIPLLIGIVLLAIQQKWFT